MASIEENIIRMRATGVPEDRIREYQAKYSAVSKEAERATVSGRQQQIIEDLPQGVTGQQPGLNDIISKSLGVTPPGGLSEEESRKMQANLLRFGVPSMAGFMLPSLSIPNLVGQALLTGSSEIGARHIEQVNSDPVLDTLWEDLKVGGFTGALDFATNLTMRGVGKAFRWVGKKLFIPSEIPDEVQIAQDTLGELPSEKIKGPAKNFMRWLKGKPAFRPFAITYGRINGEEGRLIQWFEGMARAGIGSRGVMRRFDLRSEREIIKLVEQFVEDRGTKLTGPEFATFAKRIIGETNKRGEMFVPVVAYRKFLYKQFEDALERSPGVVDGTALRNYIRESGDIEGGLPKSIYSRLRSEGLVPPLEPESKLQRTLRRTKTERISATSDEAARAMQRQDLLTGKVTQRAEQTQGVGFKSARATDVTARETESLVGLTEDEIATDWANIAPSDADKIIKIINRHWKDGMDERNNVLSYMGRKIEDPFMRIVRSDQTLNELHNAADDFFKKEVNFMRNRAIKSLRKVLSENPSKALSLLGGGPSPTSARSVYDRLMFVKKALGFSAEAPRVGEALSEALTEGGLPAGREAMEQMYDRTFLQPLRYDMITRNVDRYGRLEPTRFLDMLNSNADVPEFFNEVFGGPAQVDRIKRLMTTLAVLQQPAKEKNIFIQLTQAGAIGGFLSGGMQALLSDDVTLKETGGTAAAGAGVAILLGPYALSKMLTNATTIRMFTDGIAEGYRSGRFAIALRKLAEMHIASNFAKESPTQDAIDFYTSLGTEQ